VTDAPHYGMIIGRGK